MLNKGDSRLCGNDILPKLWVFIGIIGFLLISGIAYSSEKVDPLLNIMTANPDHAVSTMKAFGVKKAEDGLPQAEVLIKSSKVQTVQIVQELVRSVGGTPRSVINDIITATIPLDAIPILEDSDDVVYIEAARPMRVKMNYARSITRVDIVQAGTTPMDKAYLGTGVIVGIADSGIDCEHADFKDASGNTRMLAYWDQSLTSGSGVAEISSSTGVEYTGTKLSDGSCASSPDGSPIGHGTHVAGIAAGSNATYTGVAPEANIIAVRLNEPDIRSSTYSDYVTALSTSVVDAVNYIFKKAQSYKKAAVANLSIGTSLGAHDGTSLFESSLDGLLVESGTTEKKGRAIVDAAGNENALIAQYSDPKIGGIHATINVSSGSPKAFEFLTYYDPTSGIEPVEAIGGTYLDIWLESDSTCTITIKAFPRASRAAVIKTLGPISKGTGNTEATDGTATMSIDFSESANRLNGKQHAIAKVTATTSAKLEASYSFDLIFTGDCTGDAWLYYDNVNFNIFTKDRFTSSVDASLGYTHVNGDSNKTMTIPATANKVISVGSFMARDIWQDSEGNEYSESNITHSIAGKISTFSSLGFTADNRVKPELAAPGEPIISTLASTVNPGAPANATHQKLEGSSMAAPHVAGIVALMFEKNGCLYPADVKSHLIEQTTADTFTGSNIQTVPDKSWGYGKVDAVKAVNSVTASTCTPDNPSEGGGSGNSCELDSECNSGYTCKNNVCTASGGGKAKSCSLVKNEGVSLAGLFLILIPAIAVIMRRVRIN